MFKEKILKNPRIKQAFLEYDRKLRIRRLKIGSLMVTLFEPLGYDTDQKLYPHLFTPFLEMRFLCAFLAGIILILAFTPLANKYNKVLGLLLPLLPNAATSWMIYCAQGSLSPYYAGITLVLMAVALVMPWSLWETALVAFFSTVFYLAACHLYGPLDTTGVMYTNMDFLINTEIIVAIGSYLTYQWRTREFAIQFELDQNRQLLEETNHRLVELDQMKTRFFANISHELRTPLTLLIGPLEMLQHQKASWMDEETRQLFQGMYTNSMRLLKLINDLLDLVKMESGRMAVKKEPVNLDIFLKGLIQSVQPAAKDKRVELSADVDIPFETLHLDRDKLEKIVLNLVFNAIKFTPARGRVSLKAGLQGSQLLLEVQDTGIGISEKDLPFVFDRFWQADSSASRKTQGTGIGLALVKELVEIQKGEVRVESRLGQGTLMTVLLPYDKDAPVVVSDEASMDGPGPRDGQISSEDWLSKLYRRAEFFPAMISISHSIRPDTPSDSRKPKLLIADDEPDVLNFLKSQLSRRYEVLEAVDGLQAVEKTKQFLPDLVVLDMMMPEKNGIDACKELKGMISTQGIPVILLTARADDETKIAALNAGASDFLAKPFSSTELHVRVKNLVEARQFQKELAYEKDALESALEQLKDTEGQLVQSEKMASLGRLSAGIIHEINNPLNYVASALHVLKDKKEHVSREEQQKYVEIITDIEDGVQRVQRIVSDLRTFTHPHAREADRVQLAPLVDMAMRFLSHELRNVHVQISIADDQMVLTDPNKLIQVFINLFQNASDAMRAQAEKGPKDMVLEVKSRQEGGFVLVQVKDNGTGIDPRVMDKIFDPFFTTKDVGKGMGLGLSLCYRILHEQGGDISVVSEKGKYTEFTLKLPYKD